MRRGVSVRAYGCADEETVDVTVGERTGVLSKKRGGRRKKKGRFARKSTSFCSISPCPQKNEIFFSRNIRQFETKFLLLRLIKHNFPFIPPLCGVYIAQSRGTFPDPPAQMLFDLLKHRNFAISLPIETCPQDALPPNREECPKYTRFRDSLSNTRFYHIILTLRWKWEVWLR